MTHGFILGEFAPLHQGHLYLIQQARSQCDVLSILVCSGESDEIPGWQRYHWLKSSFPELDVRHWQQGQVALEAYLSKAMESAETDATWLLFESGAKQTALARALGMQHRPIDLARAQCPVSSAEIRQAPNLHWALLPAHVRPYFIQRVALVGPESCGKSYLAEHLAQHFDTVFVEEYGRTYCEKFGMDSTALDFAHVAGGQLYREDEMALLANRILFCDTDLIVTQVWSEVYFKGKCQPWIFWANHARRYDLFLLCAPDIPWVNDGLREFESSRQWMFERLKQELECRGLNHVVIQGGFETRTAMAVQAVEQLGFAARR